jgi:hypothetical protein
VVKESKAICSFSPARSGLAFEMARKVFQTNDIAAAFAIIVGTTTALLTLSLFGNRESIPLREYLCEEGDRLGQGNPS